MKYSCFNNKCIILCDEKNILKTKTFKEIIDYTDRFYKELLIYLTKTEGYVGILMNHNIYLPAIIIR